MNVYNMKTDQEKEKEILIESYSNISIVYENLFGALLYQNISILFHFFPSISGWGERRLNDIVSYFFK